MLTKDKIRELCRRVIDLAEADGVEVSYSGNDKALTRFANNFVHQNVQQKDATIDIRLIRGGVVGNASTNQWDEESLRAAVEKAERACEFGKPEEELLPLAGPQTYEEVDAYDEATAETSPDFRADQVGKTFRSCEAEGLEAAGIFSNEASVTAIANSEGLFAHHAGTNAIFSLTVSDGRVSGWGETNGPRLGGLDFDGVLDKAVEGCLMAKDPIEIEPGEYSIVLPPEATSDFLFFLAIYVFNGLAFIEGRSPFTDHLGEKLFGDNLSVRDDAFHPLMLGLPFDYEGMPRRTVGLIENGVAKAVVYDRKTALKAGSESTGHSLPQPNPWGPVPFHLVVESGDSSVDEMIASTERGLYVTHFHYTNVVDPMKQIVTGMTRDGVFMIENGKITKPVFNLRFTESAFKAWSNIEALTREQKNVSGGFGDGFVVPGMKIDNFSFTSTTGF